MSTKTKVKDARRITIFCPTNQYSDIRLSHKIGWSLSNAGYSITLVCSKPDRAEYLGMRIFPVFTPFRTGLLRIFNTPAWLIQALSLKTDLYVLYNPYTIPLAFALLLLQKKVVYDTAEDFSKRLQIRDDIPSVLRSVMTWAICSCEKLLARWVNIFIVTQSPQVQALDGKPILLENAPLIRGPIVDEVYQLRDFSNHGVLTLIYVGNFSEHRGLLTMLDVVQTLNCSQPCILKLVGWFANAQSKLRAQEHNAWHFVELYENLSHAETLKHIRHSDIGLALLCDVADHSTSSVTKLYEYMDAGIPFVASDFPRWRHSVAGIEAGVFVDPKDKEAIVAAILTLNDNKVQMRDMGVAGHNFIHKFFNWDIASAKFIQLVDNLLDSQSSVYNKNLT